MFVTGQYSFGKNTLKRAQVYFTKINHERY